MDNPITQLQYESTQQKDKTLRADNTLKLKWQVIRLNKKYLKNTKKKDNNLIEVKNWREVTSQQKPDDFYIVQTNEKPPRYYRF